VKPINLARRASFPPFARSSSPARLEGAIDLTPATLGYRSPRLASRGCADLGASPTHSVEDRLLWVRETDARTVPDRDHIGGLIPFFSAVTRPAVKVPSGFFCATRNTAAPGLSRPRSAAT
jgi:hypothetical protein